jgi:NAD(P)-dependent dehydrogenase (short-subunit alcohol dehydrogenase family)
MDLSGKVAVVTGASRGIGSAIAVELARKGADVVVAARATDESPLKLPGTVDVTARRIEALGRRGVAVQCDLSKDEDIENLARASLDAFGRVDILVNNAAIDFRAPRLELPVKRWDLIFQIDLRAPYLLSRAFLPGMIERGSGLIQNISSLAALNQYEGQLAYGTAKAALERMTMGLAKECEGSGVLVHCLRVDVPIASEGFVYNRPDLDHSNWEANEAGGLASVYMIERAEAFNGESWGISQLRREFDYPPYIRHEG